MIRYVSGLYTCQKFHGRWNTRRFMKLPMFKMWRNFLVRESFNTFSVLINSTILLISMHNIDNSDKSENSRDVRWYVTYYWENSRHFATSLITCFPVKCLSMQLYYFRNSILMMRHYPELGRASDWLEICLTSQKHYPDTGIGDMLSEYGIFVLGPQRSFWKETSSGVAKYQLFPQDTLLSTTNKIIHLQ